MKKMIKNIITVGFAFICVAVLPTLILTMSTEARLYNGTHMNMAKAGADFSGYTDFELKKPSARDPETSEEKGISKYWREMLDFYMSQIFPLALLVIGSALIAYHYRSWELGVGVFCIAMALTITLWDICRHLSDRIHDLIMMSI
jgi:hypothetical protein